jgi:alkanesulfonate monooxygenase SsuD/methylene tetrahydromethanopterin reductase-like flavin-dependent oxidoreductase (luciferase family)
VTAFELGLAWQADKPPGGYGELAAAAEAYGFDVVSVFADLLYQPPLPALLEMARATSRVRLGAACLNPFTQHPYEIAGGLALLDAVSAGRAYLGLARGAWLDAIGLSPRQPLAALRDTAAIVRALLSGDGGGYTGAVYRLAPGVRLRGVRPGSGGAVGASRAVGRAVRLAWLAGLAGCRRCCWGRGGRAGRRWPGRSPTRSRSAGALTRWWRRWSGSGSRLVR